MNHSDKRKYSIVFFFRKSTSFYFSIEKLFSCICLELSKYITISNYYVKYESKGFFKRFYNSLEVIFKQKEINHITGDVHYLSFFLKKNKTILTIHDLEIYHRSKGIKKLIIFYLWFYLPCKRVKFITTISEFTRQQLLEIIKCKPDKIRVIHNCLTTSMTAHVKNFNKQKPVLLQIGTKLNKNITNLLYAIQHINVKLYIVGKLTDSQINLLNELKIDYNNFYNISEEELINLYRESDIVTLISTYEGFGLPIIEANCIGRTVITSNISSMPEIGNNAAYYVNPLDIDDIRKGIIEIINNENLRNQLIENGFQNIKRFTPENIAKNYIELYDETSMKTKN